MEEFAVLFIEIATKSAAIGRPFRAADIMKINSGNAGLRLFKRLIRRGSFFRFNRSSSFLRNSFVGSFTGHFRGNVNRRSSCGSATVFTVENREYAPTRGIVSI